jgi:peptide/nickel transport system ATP-binding protein
MSAQPLLRVTDLTVSYRVGRRELDALHSISLSIQPGETYGLVGESGSGKSTLALAVMGYLAKNARIRSGEIHFAGRDLLTLPPNDLRALWGREIAFVPQNPATALNPSMRVGEQIAEALRLYGAEQGAANKQALALLDQVRIADAPRVAREYPHQLSGGMQQRVMIALALSGQPKLLVLDEPTTALDVTTEAAVLDLLREAALERGTAMLYVTHNLGVVATLTNRVAVLYAGELAEDSATPELFRLPLHPYSRGLLDSVPRLGQRKDLSPLQGIDGQIPALGELPSACVYAPRCPLAIEVCWQKRPTLDLAQLDHSVRCHRWPEIMAGEISAKRADVDPIPAATQAGESVLQVADLQVAYKQPRSLGQILAGRPAKKVHALRGVDLQTSRGQTLGIVGESGSGKSSLARTLIGLVDRESGNVEILGLQLPGDLAHRDRKTLAQIQMIFQNPEEALNPYLSTEESLSRPFVTLSGLSPAEARQRVPALLAAVRLPADYARRLPGQLSGGEKQRVAIARAFASQPDLLLADEPVSALDVSVQANILNLLAELQRDQQNSMLFISHDIAVVGYLADQIAVMYLGQLMQLSPAETIFAPPYHPYTEALLSSVPPPDPFVAQERIRLEGELPSALNPPSGCPFHTRCPRFLGDICVEHTPPWQTASDGSQIYCHIPLADLQRDQVPVLRFDATEGKQ